MQNIRTVGFTVHLINFTRHKPYLFATVPHSKNKPNATMSHPNLYASDTCGDESRGFSRQSRGVSPSALGGNPSPRACQNTRLASPAPQLVENPEPVWRPSLVSSTEQDLKLKVIMTLIPQIWSRIHEKSDYLHRLPH